MSIRVILADDHQIVLDGLVSLLKEESDIEILSQSKDGVELVKLVIRLAPDLVITDFSMPGLNGIEVIKRVNIANKNVKFLCLSIHNDIRLIRTILDAGYSGFLTKSCSFNELVIAVRTVMSNKIYINKDSRRQFRRTFF